MRLPAIVVTVFRVGFHASAVAAFGAQMPGWISIVGLVCIAVLVADYGSRFDPPATGPFGEDRNYGRRRTDRVGRGST